VEPSGGEPLLVQLASEPGSPKLEAKAPKQRLKFYGTLVIYCQLVWHPFNFNQTTKNGIINFYFIATRKEIYVFIPLLYLDNTEAELKMGNNMIEFSNGIRWSNDGLKQPITSKDKKKFLGIWAFIPWKGCPKRQHFWWRSRYQSVLVNLCMASQN